MVLALLVLLALTGCATAPFYYCVEVTINKGDRIISALECVPRAEKVPWDASHPPGRGLFE